MTTQTQTQTQTQMTMTTTQTRTRKRWTSCARTRHAGWTWWSHLLVLLLLLGLLELSRHQVEANNIHRRFYRRTVRLCSQSLSDALYLLCKDRGFNEPFGSGETEVRHTTGPGLVEECCYNSCSIEQMEQYCKPRGKQG